MIVPLADLPALEGTRLEPSSWIEITQERVNLFAEATDDHQWIHTDPERAKDGPFGGAIAHGFLTLALIIPMWTEVLDVEGVSTKVNYGLDRVRFTSPVRVGSRVRLDATLAAIEEVKGATQVTAAATIQIEGEERPAAIAEFITRFYA